MRKQTQPTTETQTQVRLPRPQLGDEVRDKVTEARGIVVALVMWINGCMRVVVQGKVDKDGKVPEPNTFDEPNIEVLRPGVIEPRGQVRHVELAEASAEDPTTGGPIGATPAPTSKVKL